MKSRAKGISLSYIYTLANTVIGIFMSAFIIRMLGQTEYGVYQTMTSFLTYLVLFEFGTGTIMTRNIALSSKDPDNFDVKSNYSTILIIAIGLSIVIALATGIFYAFIDRIYAITLTPAQIVYGKKLFLIIAVRTILSFLIQTLNGALLGFEQYTFGQITKLAYLIARTGLVVAALMIWPAALAVVIIDTGLTFIQLMITGWYVVSKINLHFSFKFFDKTIVIQALPLALAMFIQAIVNMANGNVDKFVIGILLSPEAVALYSVALFIYTTFSSMTTIPISMYIPQVADNMKKGLEGEMLTETLVNPCRLIAIIGGAILFGFAAIGRQFIDLLYGKTYEEAWLIALVIMGPMYINMCNGILINVLDVLRKRHVRSFILLGTTALNIVLTVWWIAHWGIIGAATATAISTILGQIILMNLYYHKVIKINVMSLYRKTLTGILPSLVAALALSYAAGSVIKNDFISFVVGGVLFCIVFLIMLWFYGSNKQEKALMRKMLKTLHLIR